MNDEYYINETFKLAKKAKLKGDFPVGALIVKNNKIISKAYNKKEYKQNSIYHAEILAINKACKKLKTWHLDNCILYTSMEPCLMCYGSIIQSHIKKIVYSAENFSFGAFSGPYGIKNNKMEIKIINNNDYLTTIHNFFNNKRSNVSRETLEKK